MNPSAPRSALEPMHALLLRRRAVIADHAFRDRDPAGHLDALRSVSEEIAAETGTLAAAGHLTGYLKHYLTRCSYDKALEAIAQEETE